MELNRTADSFQMFFTAIIWWFLNLIRQIISEIRVLLLDPVSRLWLMATAVNMEKIKGRIPGFYEPLPPAPPLVGGGEHIQYLLYVQR
jgi:hypothetical protein